MKKPLLIPACLLLLSLLPALPCPAASTKETGWKPGGAQRPAPTPPSSRELNVLSDLDPAIMEPILDFVNRHTGQRARLLPYPRQSRGGEPELSFDLFMGCWVDSGSFQILPLDGGSLRSLRDQVDGGVLRWSWWLSGVARNTMLTQGTPVQEGEIAAGGPQDARRLTGILTAAYPPDDRLTAAALYTLYREYGREVLGFLHSLVPVYAPSRERLVTFVESGRYAYAYTVDAYFKESVREGYPLEFDREGLNTAGFPVTAVIGWNIVFIPARTSNLEGSRRVVRFLADRSFQDFVEERFFSIRPPSGPGALPLNLDEGWFSRFGALWRELPFSEGFSLPDGP